MKIHTVDEMQDYWIHQRMRGVPVLVVEIGTDSKKSLINSEIFKLETHQKLNMLLTNEFKISDYQTGFRILIATDVFHGLIQNLSSLENIISKTSLEVFGTDVEFDYEYIRALGNFIDDDEEIDEPFLIYE
jgi:hypothetical protein